MRKTIYALLDDRMLESFGFPRPHPMMRKFVDAALRIRGRIVRFLPPRTKPHFFMDNPNKTYPTGYTIQWLGPPKLIAKERNDALRTPGHA